MFRSSCVTGVSSFSTTRVRPQSMRSRAVSDPTPQSPCTIAECRCRADPSRTAAQSMSSPWPIA